MDERRTHPRIPVRRKIHLQRTDGAWITLWTRDLSRDGLQILSDQVADVGDEFRLSLSVMASGARNGYVPIEMRGRVVHIIYDSRASQFRIGFRMVEISEEHRALFDNYLDYLFRRYRSRSA